jgi:hypothetical protein
LLLVPVGDVLVGAVVLFFFFLALEAFDDEGGRGFNAVKPFGCGEVKHEPGIAEEEDKEDNLEEEDEEECDVLFAGVFECDDCFCFFFAEA